MNAKLVDYLCLTISSLQWTKKQSGIIEIQSARCPASSTTSKLVDFQIFAVHTEVYRISVSTAEIQKSILFPIAITSTSFLVIGGESFSWAYLLSVNITIS